MCGIVGYIGTRNTTPIILEGLRRLEYRGYDSAGIAVVGTDGTLSVRRASGKLHKLEEAMERSPMDGPFGIGHTRWATHGRPTEANAHPHLGPDRIVVLVHNGIVENYLDVRRELEFRGHVFVTDTDTEVIAHLTEVYLAAGNTFEEAVRATIKRITGNFALAIMSCREPGKIIAVRNGPPAVVGLGNKEYFVASDVPALLNHTREMFFLHDGDMAIITLDGVRIVDFEGNSVKRNLTYVAWDPISAEKGGFKHFMLKEIHEQPRAIRDTLSGRVNRESGVVTLDEMEITPEEFRAVRQVRIVACGTSWHAGLAAKFMIEKLARLPVDVDYGSEFRYRDPIVDANTLTVVVSQSGETADTIAAQREAKRKGSKTLAICNVIGAMIPREASGTILTNAGPEIGVASTKAFTSQIAALFILAMYLGQNRGCITDEESSTFAAELTRLPSKLEQLLAKNNQCEELAKTLFRSTGFLYLGRGIHFPIALEGALKLKEISYIHAEGFPAGEMKHGPNALIDEKLPAVVLAAYNESDPSSRLRYEKTISNIQEVKAREGIVIGIINESDQDAKSLCHYAIEIPPAPELLLPLLEIVPLQLLAYHVAVRRGCDVDQPRNLAKSVTVE